MPQISQPQLKQAEYARMVHRATPEAGITLEQVQQPDYWAHVAAVFTVGDKIEVFPEGGDWYAELLVVGCSRLHAKVKVLQHHAFNEVKPVDKTTAPAPFVVEHKGSIKKWSVIRSKDREIVKDGFDTKDDAKKWLADNEADLLS